MVEFMDRLLGEDRRIYEEYSVLFSRLDELWEEYERNSFDVLHRWEKDKVILLEKISKLSGLIKRLNEEINELKIKVDVGLISEEEAERSLEELKNAVDEVSAKLEVLERAYNELVKRAEIHKKRVLPAKVKIPRDELERKLSELEERFARGEISETMYRRLKSELTELLRLASG